MSLGARLLIGRLLTRSGDQAWDFCLPIILLYTFPNHLRIAALFFLIVKLVHVVLMPRVAMTIDSTNRFQIVKYGLGLQAIGVLVTTVPVAYWALVAVPQPMFTDGTFLFSFVTLVLGGLLGVFGSSLMDIAIANDLAPTVVAPGQLTQFNSRFRQVDLFTEVASPVIAGLILTIKIPGAQNFGFFIVALWNFVSFFPEFLILKSIFTERPDLREKVAAVSQQSKVALFTKLIIGWKEFLKEPVALVMIAYALLWLSALSPHGVLLTGFLKDGWQLEEWKIGLFRGGGAVFGLLATLLFPLVVAKMSLKSASLVFLGLQVLAISAATFLFSLSAGNSHVAFLVLILFSRIGLYGFSLGEVQIRQLGIKADRRGLVNGVGSSLNGLATLALFAVGAILPSTEDFWILIYSSLACVVAGFCVYAIWIVRVQRSTSIV